MDACARNGWAHSLPFPAAARHHGRVLTYLVSLLVVGFVIGVIARLLLPGRDPMGCFATALLGIAGSVVGGLLAAALFGSPGRHTVLHPVGLLGSVAGAMVLLLVLRLLRGGRR
jgi:uncharacterized membrane protein YeaQ/YmgE (transglycosylase-associated protein family)